MSGAGSLGLAASTLPRELLTGPAMVYAWLRWGTGSSQRLPGQLRALYASVTTGTVRMATGNKCILDRRRLVALPLPHAGGPNAAAAGEGGGVDGAGGRHGGQGGWGRSGAAAGGGWGTGASASRAGARCSRPGSRRACAGWGWELRMRHGDSMRALALGCREGIAGSGWLGAGYPYWWARVSVSHDSERGNHGCLQPPEACVAWRHDSIDQSISWNQCVLLSMHTDGSVLPLNRSVLFPCEWAHGPCGKAVTCCTRVAR